MVNLGGGQLSEPKRPFRRVPNSQLKRRQATIDAMLANVPGYRRALTVSNRIVLGTSLDHAILCCPACLNGNLRQSHFTHGPNRMVLMFSCQDCDKKPELMIEQHDGQTSLVWRY